MSRMIIEMLGVWRFESPEMLRILGIVPILVALVVIGVVAARRNARIFIHPKMLPRIQPSAGVFRSACRGIVLCASIALLGVSLARPQSDPSLVQVERAGRDVCVVLDVSRSMLADDVAPNRMNRAKMWIDDAVGVAGADQLALVAFAGSSTTLSPLTHDHVFFRLMLQEAGPDSVIRGGSMIGDALRHVASEVFKIRAGDDEPVGITLEQPRFRDVILITDGEDHGSFPVEAAVSLGKAGVRLIILGIGSESGSKISIVAPDGRSSVIRNSAGDPVVTRLDSEALARMALATPGGRYFPVADGTIKLDQIYRSLVSESGQNAADHVEQLVYRERFQIILFSAMVLLFIEQLLGIGRRSQ